ncbi:AAA family ATPase [Parabacteroides sp. PF5-9]|uniref:AAA family ATPase n=1 Tax=Parabacteroides sp. PF5-9 TaxID=1742404 RepID=UPI0024746858|nr:AAA family ATPase [Parabacteroides sp. PF5-9]MDH6356243.1 ABC-type cobalamin/Fe3+-siderophores transport system ATPase subunit [Parabacteroides sp. PF5-9]
MKITKVNIPTVSLENGIPNDGLSPIVMNKLGDIVLLVGKNGSGKSRILKKISSTIQKKPIKKEVESSELNIEQLKNNISLYHNSINNNFKPSLEKATKATDKQRIKQQIEQSKQSIKESEDKIKRWQLKQHWNFIETDILQDSYKIVYFVPKKLDLKDCNALTPTQLKTSSENVKEIGVEKLSDCSLAKIKKVVDNHFNATHQNYQGDAGLKQNAIEEYTLLDDLIYAFLGTRLDRNIDGDTTLFNFPIGSAKLSDGQKILLQLCVAIHAQGASLDNMILFLDEPENHMHPSVTIEFLDALIKKVPNGQIWIATHSIPLISHFGTGNIWYVDNGNVSYAGREQEKVLESLLGNEDEIEKLNDLINLSAVSAINNFAYECLSPPNAVMTTGNDPQSKQIGFILMEELRKGKVKLLDYGAGKGRFVNNFFDRLNESERLIVQTQFEYVAFDKYNNDKDDCLKNIERVYGDSEKKYYNDFTSLLSDHDKGSFDIVVLCNVLHEIDPKEWLELFKAEGDITPLLKDNSGVLLHVEDMLLPVGEKAYRNGFIVLDTPHIKELFQLRSSDLRYFTSNEAKFKDRLKAHLVPKNNLASITEETRRKALEGILKTAKDEIRTIRDATPDYKSGKKHAFWVQQFANSSLALSELSNGK